ncbi:hypothetical protein JCM10908_004493 [Rhodotorula pacifica]|uniref:uncharacterized protein n=1 Tax=Rhodotorula pacifica TaxID=1495444 RepID=UPI00316DE4FF
MVRSINGSVANGRLPQREIMNVPLDHPRLPASVAPSQGTPGTIDLKTLLKWHDDLDKDSHYQLSKTILCHTNPNIVLASRDAKVKDEMIFNHVIAFEGDPVANQLVSGRCWLFALCNVVRIATTRKFKLSKFQLSQSYLFFYDHLSKANWFLEQILDLAGEKLDSRKMQFLMQNLPAQDGGQWDLAVSLVENFGLVPQHVFPESWNSSNSSALDTLLTSKLREMGLQLRRFYRELQGQHPNALDLARREKEKMLKVIYRILTINLGTPPQPSQPFLWEYTDKAGKYHGMETTPLEFARIHAGFDVSDTVSLLNDPRNPFRATYTIERLGNVVGGRDLVFLNLPVNKLKSTAIAMIKNDIPVWFGCDVDKAADTENGFLDTKLRDLEAAFGTHLTLDKKDRLLAYDSSMTHAMMLTGVHVDPITNLPVRWRVENSWGPDACNKGFLVMTDEWFDEYVFQIVAPRGFVDRDLLEIYDDAPHSVQVLPMWDTLASEAGELNYAYLGRQYGSLEVACVDCEASTSKLSPSETDEPPVATFEDLLQLWRRGRGRTKYLKDWHLPLAIHRRGAGGQEGVAGKGKGKERVREELYDVPPAWLDDWMNEYEASEKEDDFRFVYAGGGDTFTPLHRDVYCSYSISTQLFGRKRWYLFPPRCASSLRILIRQAEREDANVNCEEWDEELKTEYSRRGMIVVEQEVGESIFIPSGWYHSVTNLSHPTLSLNHNWLNAHNLPAVYRSLSEEAARCREAISDVKEMLIRQAPDAQDAEKEGWRREWEETVNGLIEQSEGWSWPTFWRMTRFALENLDQPLTVLEERAATSRWPFVPPEVRPPTQYVVQQVRPLLLEFRAREEQEWRWLPGLEEVLQGVDRELDRLDAN